MEHKLIIKSLSDAQAECACGRWSFVKAGSSSKEEIQNVWRHHVRWALEVAIERLKRKLMKTPMRENFGQDEVRMLKDQFGYNPYGNEKERTDAMAIALFDFWASGYTGVKS